MSTDSEDSQFVIFSIQTFPSAPLTEIPPPILMVKAQDAHSHIKYTLHVLESLRFDKTAWIALSIQSPGYGMESPGSNPRRCKTFSSPPKRFWLALRPTWLAIQSVLGVKLTGHLHILLRSSKRMELRLYSPHTCSHHTKEPVVSRYERRTRFAVWTSSSLGQYAYCKHLRRRVFIGRPPEFAGNVTPPSPRYGLLSWWRMQQIAPKLWHLPVVVCGVRFYRIHVL